MNMTKTSSHPFINEIMNNNFFNRITLGFILILIMALSISFLSIFQDETGNVVYQHAASSLSLHLFDMCTIYTG